MTNYNIIMGSLSQSCDRLPIGIKVFIAIASAVFTQPERSPLSPLTNLQALWCFIWRRIDSDFRHCHFFRPKKTCNCPILPLIQIHLLNHKKLSSIPNDFLCMKCFLFRKCEYRDRRSISGADHHGGMKPHASYRHPHILYLLI